jgi:lipopolysaccharide heptosyltransferase II
MPRESWTTARRLLCVRLDSLGDVLMTTPAIRALKQASPRRHITLLTSPSGAAIASLVPEIDDCIVYEAPWLKHTPPRESPETDHATIGKLAERQFDAAVIFTVFSQNPLPSALLCYLAGIPLRLAHCRENPYQLLTEWVAETEPQQGIRHEVRRQLDLVGTIGAYASDQQLSLSVPPGARERIAGLLSDPGLQTQRRWLVVHPGATASSRRYPPELFAAAIENLIERQGFQVVLTGQSDERELIESIQAGISQPAISLAGRLSLPDMAALLSLAPLLLSNNTGPVHMAAALGTPVVDLYALTNPQHTPWMTASRVLMHDVPCRNCFKSVCPEGHHDCLRRIAPERVVAAVLDLWGETQGAASPLPTSVEPALARPR